MDQPPGPLAREKVVFSAGRDAASVRGSAFFVAGLAGLIPAIVGLTSTSAHAEFEIPEVDAEKGAFEAEYRGASHWGLPPRDEDDESDLLRQSHELELQYGLTDWWMLRLTPNFE